MPLETIALKNRQGNIIRVNKEDWDSGNAPAGYRPIDEAEYQKHNEEMEANRPKSLNERFQAFNLKLADQADPTISQVRIGELEDGAQWTLKEYSQESKVGGWHGWYEDEDGEVTAFVSDNGELLPFMERGEEDDEGSE